VYQEWNSFKKWISTKISDRNVATASSTGEVVSEAAQDRTFHRWTLGSTGDYSSLTLSDSISDASNAISKYLGDDFWVLPYKRSKYNILLLNFFV